MKEDADIQELRTQIENHLRVLNGEKSILEDEKNSCNEKLTEALKNEDLQL